MSDWYDEWKKEQKSGSQVGAQNGVPVANGNWYDEWKTERDRNRMVDFTSRYNAWAEQANALVKNANERFFDENGTFQSAYRSDAKDWYSANESAFREVESQRQALLGGLNGITGLSDEQRQNLRKALSNNLSDLAALAKFEAQFDSEHDYQAHVLNTTTGNEMDAINKRRSTAAALEARIAELDKLIAAEPTPDMNFQGGPGDLFTYLGHAIAGTDKTESQKAYEAERDKLQIALTKYERGSKVWDDYYGKYHADPNYAVDSQNRSFANPTREELDKYDTTTDSSTWHRDADGNYYDAFGTKIDLNNVDEKGHLVHPTAGSVEISDPLGFYLNATDEDVKEAVAIEGQSGAEGSTWATAIMDGEDGSWKQLEESEIGMYYHILNTYGRDAAVQFLSDMKTELNRRSEDQYNADLGKAFSEANYFVKMGLSAATIPAQAVSNVAGGVEDAINLLSGKDINPYSAAHGGMNFSHTTRELRAEELDNWAGGASIPLLDFGLGDTYQAIMSAGDMLTSLAVGSKGYGAVMGLGAFSSTAKDLYEQGASNLEITTVSGIAGIAEGFFEKYSVDKLIKIGDTKTLGQFFKNMLLQGGIEASEEIATETANIIADTIIRQGTSNWAQLVEENGGNVLAALGAELQQIGKAGMSGFLSGTLTGGGASGINYANYRAAAKEAGYDTVAAGQVGETYKLAQALAEKEGNKTFDKLVKKAAANQTVRSIGRVRLEVEEALSAGRITAQEATQILAATEQQNTAAETGSGEVKYQIRHTTDNRPVVEVTDNILEGVDKKDWQKTVKKTISEKFSDGIPISGRLIKVTRKTRGEYTHSQDTQRLYNEQEQIYEDKMTAAGNLDEIVLASTNYINEDLNHERADDIKEFARGDVLMRVGGRDYSAKVVVGYTTGGEMLLYDVVDFEPTSLKLKGQHIANTALPQDAGYNGGDVLSTTSISDPVQIVKSMAKKFGVDAQTVELMVEEYDSKSDPVAYAQAFATAYTFARYNLPMDDSSAQVVRQTLSDISMRHATQLGRLAAKTAAAEAQTKVEARRAKLAKGGADTADINTANLTARQRQSIGALDALGKALGVRFVMYDSQTSGRGTISTDSRVKHSIVALEDGKIYVQASRNVVHGETVSEQRASIKQFFNDLLQNKPSLDIPTIEGDVLTITKAETAEKARDNYKSEKGTSTEMTADEFRVKLNAEAHIDELAETSRPQSATRARDTKNHSFAKDGFTYRTAYFRDFDGQYYEITLSIGHSGDVATVYNVGKIKNSVSPSAKLIAVVGSQPRGETLSTSSISDSAGNVNTKKSQTSGEVTENGFYTTGTNEIYVDVRAGLDARGTILYTASHELTHFIEDWSPAKYREFSDFLMKELGKTDADVTAWVAQQKALLRRAGTELTGQELDDAAFAEVVAQACESFLTQPTVLESIERLAKQNQSLYSKIRSWLKRFYNKLRKARLHYDQSMLESAEGRAVAEMTDTVAELVELWSAGLVDAAANAQAADVRTDGETVTEGMVKCSIKNTSSMSIQEQLKKYRNGEMASSDAFYFGKTPSSIGESGLRELPLVFTQSDYKKSHSIKHSVPFRLIKSLNSLLENSLFSFDADGRYGFVTKEIDADGKPLLIAVEANVQMDWKPVNAVRSVYGVDDPAAWIKNQIKVGKRFVAYNKNETDHFLRTYGYLASVNGNVESLRDRIPHSSENVKEKLSDRDTVGVRKSQIKADAYAHDTAGRRLSAEQQEFFKDSKVRDENGNLIALYHGTENGGFTVFDAAKSDDGISLFFTDDLKVAETYSGSDDDVALPAAKPPMLRWTEGNTKRGKQQAGVYEVYLNLKNPLVVECEGKTWGSIPFGDGTPVDLSYHIKHGEIVFSVKAKDRPTQTVRFADNANTAAEVRKFLTKTFNKEIGKRYSELFASVREDDADYGWKDSFERAVAFSFNWDFSNNTPVPTSTRGIAAQAKKEGYDGVIFRNLHDYGGHKVKGVSYASKKTTNIYVAFNKNAVKDVDNKTPTANKDIRYQARAASVRRILAEALDAPYSYRTLTAKADMKIVQLSETVPESRKDVMTQAKKNAAEVGKTNEDGSVSVFVEDIGREVVLGNSGLKHGLDRRFSESAPVTLQAGAILKNSIRINELRPERKNADGSYVLIGAASSTSGQLYIVRSVVNQFRNELVEIDVLYAINAKKESAALNAPRVSSPVTDSTISISDLLEYVNRYFPDVLSEDVLRYFGHTVRPAGELGKSAQFQPRISSPRTTLAEALESTAVNEQEQKLIRDYLEQVDELDAAEQELAQVNKQIRDMMFSKGERDAAFYEKLGELHKRAGRLKNRIEWGDKQLLSLRSTTPIDNLLDRERAAAAKRAKEAARKEYRERRENAQKTELRDKLSRRVRHISSMLLRGNKQRNVKPELQELTVKALESAAALFEESGENIGECLVALEHAYQDLGELDPNAKDIPKAERARVQQNKELYKPEVAELLADVRKEVGTKPVSEMDIATLEKVNTAFTALHHTLTESNKVFKNGKAEDVETAAGRALRELQGLKLSRRDIQNIALRGLEKYSWANENPVFAFDRIGSKELSEMFWDLIAGQDTWARDMQDARDLITHLRKKYGFNEWEQTKRTDFKLESGQTFSLNLQEIMSVYAYSKREQALPHMTDGGFVFSDEAFSQGKFTGKWLHHNTAVTYRLTEADISKITAALTKEQKGYADELQAYLSTTMGTKGNEVSRVLYGIDLFKERHYFPLQSSRQFLASTQAADSKQPSMVSLKNTGMTKEIVPGAGNPIVLRGFDVVCNEHIDKMSQYHGLVLPIENLQKVFNYTSYAADGGMISVRNQLTATHGDGAVTYLQQLLSDLNGGISQPGVKSPTLKMFAKFKKTAVGASLSTVVQQPTAIVRAMALIDPKYFAQKAEKVKTYEEIKRYAPIATVKEIGGFDTGSTTGAVAWLDSREYDGIGQKAKAVVTDENYRDELWMKGAQKADELGWSVIWNAVKAEVADKQGLSVGSEAFYQACGKRFTEVIVRSQVYDSVLSRSGFMRSSSELNKMATSFMGEPTMSFNMMASTIRQAIRTRSTADIQTAARTVATVYAAQMLAKLFATFVYALRKREEDEPLLERWMQEFAGGWPDLLPFAMLPYVRDVQSLLMGYTLERSDMSVLGDLIDGVKTIFSTDYTDPADAWKAAEEGVGLICNAFGLPIRNLLRDFRSMCNLVMAATDTVVPTDMGGALLSGLSFKEKGKSDRLYTAFQLGDEQQIETLREGYASETAFQSAVVSALRQNDERIKQAAAAAVQGDFDALSHTADAIYLERAFKEDIIDRALQAEYAALSKSLGKAATYKATGDTSSYADIVEEIRDDYAGILTQDGIRHLVAATAPSETAETDESSVSGGSVYTMTMVNAALESGDSGQAVNMIDELYQLKQQKYRNDGKSRREAEKSARSDMRSSLNNYWKQRYIAAYNSQDRAEQMRIKELLSATGMYTSAGGYKGLAALLQEWRKEAMSNR